MSRSGTVVASLVFQCRRGGVPVRTRESKHYRPRFFDLARPPLPQRTIEGLVGRAVTVVASSVVCSSRGSPLAHPKVFDLPELISCDPTDVPLLRRTIEWHVSRSVPVIASSGVLLQERRRSRRYSKFPNLWTSHPETRPVRRHSAAKLAQVALHLLI